ncbi:Hypothetical protein NGAL_HAMBI2605_10340 [Neorhizobium galegae bv. orientalis]|nr:Hypothetical protein NGAL_HAMBI2605_10340 [Neorhizobium galegae bv. orientalis]
MADNRIQIQDLPPTSTQARTDMIPSQKAGGGTVFLTIAQILGLINSDDVSTSLAAATSDNTIVDADELLYLSGSTVKKGLFSGFITSLFNGTRKIANGFFEADSLRFYKASTGLYGWLDTSGLTATRKMVQPDRDITLGMVRLSQGPIPANVAVDWAVTSGPRRIVMVLSAYSTNGTGVPMLQLKTGGAAETSGYSGGAANSGSASGLANSSGFYLNSGGSAALSYDVVIELILLSGNTWVFRVFGSNSGPGTTGGGGSKTLAGPIDGLRLTTPGGVNVPDGGEYALYAEY